MAHSVTEERFVPALEHDRAELVEQQDHDFIKDEHKADTVTLPRSPPVAEQIDLGERLLLDGDNSEHTSEEKTEEYLSADHIQHVTGNEENSSVTESYSDPQEHSQEVPLTPQKAVNQSLQTFLDLPKQADENTSSSTSDDMSISCGSSDSEVPDFFQPPQDHDTGQLSAPNEVVSGHQFQMHILEKGERVPNLAIPPKYPEQQASLACDDTGSLLYLRDKWPPLPHELKPDDHASSNVMETDNHLPQVISMVEALTVSENIQQTDRHGSMVIGLGRRTLSEDLDSQPLISPDVISNQHHFLEESVQAIGKALNHVVSAVHNDSSNDVKFRVRTRISKRKVDNNRCIFTTQDIAVSNPSESPEASDGRLVLKHMCSAFRVYADVLDYPSSEFKTHLSQIIGRTPRKRNPSLTWAILFNTLFLMRYFIEKVADVLESNDRYTLASLTRVGINELNDITENAKQAQQLSVQLTP